MVFAARIQFAFTVMFHYLFPILTMGLGFFIALMSTLHLTTGDRRWDEAARFWARIFAIGFVVGVVTGIPLEFEFGSNWAAFSAYGGSLFGQLLPMEGVYAFFLESGFLGLFLFGRGRVGKWLHWAAGLGVGVGSLLSGYFITAANAWMQHPVGYRLDAHGQPQLVSFWAVLFNPFAGWQYAHVVNGALLAGAFVMAAIAAFYLLSRRHQEFAQNTLRLAVVAGCILSLTQLFPTGDLEGRHVAGWQPAKLAAMEGLYQTRAGAPLAVMGMPNSRNQTLLDPVYVPRILSFLAYGSFRAQVVGLAAYPRDLWPPVALTYYAYHIMVGLGTIFVVIMLAGAFLLWRRRLYRSRWFLWVLMLALPFPFIANEAGWMATEVGRQPWLVYGLLRTAQGVSPNVAAGETIFTLLGFMGIYAVLALLYLFLTARVIGAGPESGTHGGAAGGDEASHAAAIGEKSA